MSHRYMNYLRRNAMPVMVVMGIVCMITFVAGPALIVPLRELRPVWFEPELASLISDVKTVCTDVSSNALVYIPEPGLFADRMAPPLRAVCGARVAVGDVTPGDSTAARQLHDAAAAAQRPFVVVSDEPNPFGDTATVPSPHRVTTATYERLELAVESVPDVFWDEQFEVWVAPWP